jgi:hypothetical protein
VLKLDGKTAAEQALVDMMIDVAGDYRGPVTGLCYRYLIDTGALSLDSATGTSYTQGPVTGLCYRYLIDTWPCHWALLQVPSRHRGPVTGLCYRYLIDTGALSLDSATGTS